MPFAWYARPAALAAGALVLLLATGCEDKETLRPEERRLALGTNFGPVACASEPDSSNRQVAVVPLIATVFGQDGSLAQNVPVTFTMDAQGPGSFFIPYEASHTPEDYTGTGPRELSATSDQLGHARVDLIVPEGDTPFSETDRSYVRQAIATIADPVSAPQKTIKLFVPAGPRVVPSTAETVADEKILTFNVGLEMPCSVGKVEATLEYPPALLTTVDNDGDGTVDTGVYTNAHFHPETATCTGTNCSLSVQGDDSGVLTVVYERLTAFPETHANAGSRGTSVPGIYLQFKLRAHQQGTAEVKLRSVKVWRATRSSSDVAEYRLRNDTSSATDNPLRTFSVTITAPSTARR